MAKEERMLEGRDMIAKRELIQGIGGVSVCFLIIKLFLSKEREKTAVPDLRISSHQFLCYFKEA